MTSSDDCKALLDQDAQVMALGSGPWKSLGKQITEEGVERVFQNRPGTCFVRVLEDASGLRVTSVGPDLASMVASSPVSAPFPTGQLCTNRCTDPSRIQAARQFLRELDQGEEDLDSTPGGVALANRLLFGVLGGATGLGPPWVESGAEGVLVTIVPDTQWHRDHELSDWPLPIEGLFPDPHLVESPNETSDFLIHGQADVYAAVRLMLDAGFVWDESVQAYIEEGHTTIPGLVDWVREGAPARPGPVQPQPVSPPRVFTPPPFPAPIEVTTQAELVAQVAMAKGVIVVVDDDPPLSPGFWRESESLCRQMNQSSRPKLGAAPGPAWVVVRAPSDSPLNRALREGTTTFGQPGPHVGLTRAGSIFHASDMTVRGTIITSWENLLDHHRVLRKRKCP